MLRNSASKDTNSGVAGSHGASEDGELRTYLKGLISGTPFDVTDREWEDRITGKGKAKVESN